MMNPRRLTIIGIPVLLLGLGAYFALGDFPGAERIDDPAGGGTPVETRVVDARSAGQDEPGGDRGAVGAVGSRESLVDHRGGFDAALAGFKGRVVDHQRRPLGDRIVRFYRVDSEVLQNRGLFTAPGGGAVEGSGGETPSAEIVVQVRECRTDGEGRFLVTGAWPRSVYILEADAEGDDRLTMPVDRTPGPGEVVDLGDIQLVQLGTIVGRVVDEAGNGVAGAMIRAADVPGTLLDLAPVERFEPDGALIVREGQMSMVVEMPPFVKRYFDILMRPRTETATDGTFRLSGVQPRENVVAVNRKSFVAKVEKGIKVQAGKEKDIGTIRLRRGEEAFVKVVDTAEAPVAGAEVLIGGTLALAPVDMVSRVGRTDAKGELYATGWPAGKITVAARRSRSHPWVVAKPQNVAGDVVVQLPGSFHLDLTILSAAGAEIAGPRFKLLPSPDQGVPLDFGAMGFVKWLDIDRKVEPLEKPGRYRIVDLNPGKYTLAVTARGHAAARVDFTVEQNTAATVTLRPQSPFVVRVVDAADKPVVAAKIYVLTRTSEKAAKLLESPVVAGETGEDGTLRVADGEAGTVRLSASHPAFGYAHAEARLPSPDPIVLRMESPGALRGVLREHGRPPTPGKWTIIATPQSRGRQGAMIDLPKFTVPDLEGNFAVSGLNPGKYRVMVMKSIQALTSAGGLIGFMMRARMLRDVVTEEVEIVAGRATEVQLEAVKEPEPIDGPSAQVSGIVLVDGRPGAGLTVRGLGSRRYGVTADAGGRFDFGQVPVGELEVEVHDTSKADVVDMMMESHLWSRRVKVEAEQPVILDIHIRTGRMAGVVRTPTGAVAAGVTVKVRGTAVEGESKLQRSSVAVTTTNDQGRYTFDSVPSGVYTVEAGDRRRGVGTAGPFELLAGGAQLSADVELRPVYSVSGRVELGALGGERPEWCYLLFQRAGNEGGGRNHGSSVRRDGTFQLRGVVPGEYRVTLHVPERESAPGELAIAETVVVTDRDVAGVVLTPQRKPPDQSNDRSAGKSGDNAPGSTGRRPGRNRERR